MPSRPVALLQDVDVLAVADAVRRYVASAGVGNESEDITQETIARLIANRWRVDRRTAPGYAIATARSLIISRQRDEALASRHQHRLLDAAATADPEQNALAAEEEAILSSALAMLSERDQLLLVGHHVEGLSTADLAALRTSSPGAISAALARARGRLKLEYCLQAHRRHVIDPRCRSILTAIAVGDGRRQTALGASRHLPTCEDCRSLASAVTSPDRHGAMAGLLTLLTGGALLLRRLVTTHPAATAAAGVVTAGGVTAAVVLLPQGHAQPPHAQPPHVQLAAVPRTAPTTPPAAPAPRHGVLLGSHDLLDLPAGTPLSSFVGHAVLGRSVPVLAVDANEGFWIGTSNNRIWVQLVTHGESAITVKAGTLIDFAGTVVANGPSYAHKVGVSRTEDATYLTAQKAHLSVPVHDIAVVPPGR